MNAMKRRSSPKSAEEQWIAYHEAGHAVAAILLGIKFDEVSFAPEKTSQYKGSTTVRLVQGWQQLIKRGLLPPEEADRLACFCFAGDAAQCRFAPRSVRLRHKAFDVRAVLDILDVFPVPERGERMLRARMRAEEMVESHWAHVQAVANTLVQKRKLGETDIRVILGRVRRGSLGRWRGTA